MIILKKPKLPESSEKGLINPLRMQNQTNGEQHEHLVGLLVDLVVLVGLGLEHGLGPLDVEQDVGECSDCIGVSSHHHVGKSKISHHINSIS